MSASTGAQPALAPGLARKVKKIMETRVEAPEVVGSLSTLSTFFSENTPAARRRLRSTIENQGVRVNEEFLAAAEGVLKMLDVVQSDLDALSSCCDAMGASLAGSRAAAADLLHDTDKLQRSLQVSETRSQLVGRFLEQYQLTPAEAAALQGDEVGPEFFAALAHVRTIHANCKALLRTHHQRAGLELMDTMSSLQENAYERLCRWVQQECRSLSEADAPEINPLLQQAAAALRERPVLFKYCAEEVAQARHTALFQRFIKALTRGPRPIEMHAHDPRRYVSDMLAWVHASLASEQEFLVSLFGGDASQEGGGAGAAAAPAQRQQPGSGGGPPSPHAPAVAAGEATSPADGAPTIPQLLDSVFESICRPLKVRIEQVLMSSPPPLLCFRLAQLLAFYLETVEPLLGAGSQLADALRSSRAMAQRTFSETLRQRGDKLLRYPPSPPRDLAPPQQLVEGAQLLADLISSYEQSMHQHLPGGPGSDDFSAVLSAVVDPLAEMCSRSSEALNPTAASRVDEGAHLDPTDQRVFLVNCLFALAAPLAGHECALKQAQALHDALEGHVGAVVAAEVARTLRKCGGLAQVVERVQRAQEAGQPPGGDPDLGLERVGGAMRTFFARLSDPAMLPELPKLQVPRLKAEAVQRVLQALADAYATVHAALLDPGSGYDTAAVGEALFAPARDLRAWTALFAACLLAGTASTARAACSTTDDDSGCQTCSADGSKCELCWDNYALTEAGECVQCTVPEEAGRIHCLTCSSTNVSQCITCEPYCNTGGCRGYYAVEGGCQPCPSASCANCTQTDGTCTACHNGYGLVDGECRACLVEGCRTCDGDLSTCTDCLTPKPYYKPGFYVDPTTGNCTECAFGCHECSADGKKCETCSFSTVDEATGTCPTCKDANCIDCSSDVATCNSCNSTYGAVGGKCEACGVTNCASCDEDTTTCTSCLDGFGLVNGTCQACTGEGCIYCDDDASSCTGCAWDYQAWNPDEKACTNCTVANCSYCNSSNASACSACADGYTNDETTGGCKACSVDYCRFCNSSPCDSCLDGYWYDELTSTCTACIAGCAVCGNGQGSECDRCAVGYYLVAADRTCKECSEADAAAHPACAAQATPESTYAAARRRCAAAAAPSGAAPAATAAADVAANQLPRTPAAMVDQAAAAVQAAGEAGQLRQTLFFLLPVNEKESDFNNTEPLDYPCSLQKEFDTVCALTKSLMQRLMAPGTEILAKRIDDGGVEGEPSGVLYPADKSFLAVVFPTADRLKELQSYAKEAGRPLLIVNPQWRNEGQVVSDFGIGPWKRAAEDFLGQFEPTYALKEKRIGSPGTIDAARGARFVTGGVVRLLRCWPGVWEAHAMAPNGASQLLETAAAEPSYKDLDAMIRRGRDKKLDIFRIAMEVTAVYASSSGTEREEEEEEGAAAGPVDPAALTSLAELSDADIEAADAATLRRLLLGAGQPASGRIAKLRERLREVRDGNA
ncbi:Conserved oligomeric Golgi complex subunit 6 [Micractinium conductrix]|uniref:Conserved oligomeric Golgi complex subunit 6 n=1 Tax=Micractinium conductrix TaxID=554055 RepID=A0A2P6VPQ2_9CHLO|nr:Conserved oligomeric Golgi complex subunit 6 [Micractinium conductrix]|eukprot:PSC76084.1 Conserved oligomeric Golgi complex subunit 6 [Micractinium conductrix]